MPELPYASWNKVGKVVLNLEIFKVGAIVENILDLYVIKFVVGNIERNNAIEDVSYRIRKYLIVHIPDFNHVLIPIFMRL